MRRLCLVIGVLIVGLVLCRGSVQPVHAANYILSGDSDCAAIGIWNAATKTCTLLGNVHGSIEIRGSGVTLDGNGFAIIGAGIGEGNGIEVVSFNAIYSNVTIKNVTLSGWRTGIYLHLVYTSTIANSTIAENTIGIVVSDSPLLTIASTTISGSVLPPFR